MTDVCSMQSGFGAQLLLAEAFGFSVFDNLPADMFLDRHGLLAFLTKFKAAL